MKKIVLLVFVSVLLSIAVIVGFVRPIVAHETIYIRSDGSVEGTDKIQRDGDLYTFIDNIYDSIVVERDNIVVDGAGYTVQGTWASASKGISLSGRSNVTIKNMTVKAFDYGIWLNESSNNSISGNTITNHYDGIELIRSSNNMIYGNTITNNCYGIYFYYSSNNTIYHNNFIDNAEQVYSYASTNVWDDGYPSGGNYWSDYEERYPDADELDDLGIWDTPYVIDENNQDNYPIIPEFPTWTSMLLILTVLTVATAFYKRRLPKTPIH